MNKKILGLIAVALLAGPMAANAALLVDRGLPTTNLNNAAGANRSNVSWVFSGYTSADYWLVGDTLHKQHVRDLVDYLDSNVDYGPSWNNHSLGWNRRVILHWRRVKLGRPIEHHVRGWKHVSRQFRHVPRSVIRSTLASASC